MYVYVCILPMPVGQRKKENKGNNYNPRKFNESIMSKEFDSFDSSVHVQRNVMGRFGPHLEFRCNFDID